MASAVTQTDPTAHVVDLTPLGPYARPGVKVRTVALQVCDREGPALQPFECRQYAVRTSIRMATNCTHACTCCSRNKKFMHWRTHARAGGLHERGVHPGCL